MVTESLQIEALYKLKTIVHMNIQQGNKSTLWKTDGKGASLAQNNPKV